MAPAIHPTDALLRPVLLPAFHIQYDAARGMWQLQCPHAQVELNASAAEILRRCDGQRTITMIVQEVETWFNTQGIADDVHTLIAQVLHKSWLCVAPQR